MSRVSRRSFLSGPRCCRYRDVAAAGRRESAGASKRKVPASTATSSATIRLTALYDGIWYLPIDGKFVRNASGAEVNQALAAAFFRQMCCR